MSTAGKAVTAAVSLALLFVLVFVVFAPRTDDSERKAGDAARFLEKFRALPYAMFGDEEVDSASSGVIFHDPSRSYPGYNFYASKVAPRVWLLDMAGNVVHQWASEEAGRLVYAIMLANGDVLALYRYFGLERFDWDSRPLWRKHVKTHHDVSELPDGSLYTLSAETILHRGLQVRFPVILHLSPSGDEVGRWSSYEHMDEIKRVFDRRSFLDTVLDSLLAETDSVALYGMLRQPDADERVGAAKEKRLDYFHVNTVGVLPATPAGLADERFKEGNLLMCFRNVNQIAVLHPETWEVLWAWGEGELEWPHDPTMLENGNILVFDNGVERKYSRAVELNPRTGDIEWQFVADPPESFYSDVEGSAQRLPNGNTLICESTRGRVFEVTRGGDVVWEWRNPEIDRGRRARIYRMMRLPADLIDPLLDGESPARH